MFWQKNKYIILLILYVSVFILLMFGMPRQIDWSPSFSEQHTRPYGCYILRNELPSLYDNENKIVNVNQPFYNYVNEDTTVQKGYIAVNQYLTEMDDLDVDELWNFVKEGNKAFLSAGALSYYLMDSLGLRLNSIYFDNRIIQNTLSPFSKAECRLFLNIKPNKNWITQSDMYVNYIETEFSKYPHTVLGSYDSKPNFVAINIGDGTMYLHSFPFAFTNFNILENDMQTYVANCLSYVNSDEILWDENYKAGIQKYPGSPLATLLAFPSARWGIYLGVLGILLFMIFSVKRRQRAIPIVEPYRNDNVTFSNTLGDLYFQNQNHKDLALKKIKFFKDFVHEKYRIQEINFKPEEIFVLARKSGRDNNEIETLFKLIQQVFVRQHLSNSFLLNLNKKLHTFYYGK